MGYTTIYAGQIELDRPLTLELLMTLHKLREGEKEVTPGGTVMSIPLREIAGYKPIDGWCQWVPTKDGTALVWDKREKFYEEIEWIHWLKGTLLQDYEMNGMLYALGEDWGDTHTLTVSQSVATRTEGLVNLEHNAELLAELIQAEEEYHSGTESRARILEELCNTQGEIEGLLIDLDTRDMPDIALTLLRQIREELQESVKRDTRAATICRNACAWYVTNPTRDDWSFVKVKFRACCDTETEFTGKQGSAHTLMGALHGRSDMGAEFWLEAEQFKAELKEFRHEKVWKHYERAIAAYEALPATRAECVKVALEETEKLQAGVGKVVGDLAGKMRELLADHKDVLTTDPKATGQVVGDLQRFSDVIWQVRKALAWRTSK